MDRSRGFSKLPDFPDAVPGSDEMIRAEDMQCRERCPSEETKGLLGWPCAGFSGFLTEVCNLYLRRLPGHESSPITQATSLLGKWNFWPDVEDCTRGEFEQERPAWKNEEVRNGHGRWEVLNPTDERRREVL